MDILENCQSTFAAAVRPSNRKSACQPPGVSVLVDPIAVGLRLPRERVVMLYSVGTLLGILPAPLRYPSDHPHRGGEAGLTASPTLLDRRTRNRSVGAKHAAIARQRLKTLAAVLTVVEELARVGGHNLNCLMAALRAGDRRF